MLGCTAPVVLGSADAIVFVADGRFHLEAIMIANPDIPAFRCSPGLSCCGYVSLNWCTEGGVILGVQRRGRRGFVGVERREGNGRCVLWAEVKGEEGYAGQDQVPARCVCLQLVTSILSYPIICPDSILLLFLLFNVKDLASFW